MVHYDHDIFIINTKEGLSNTINFKKKFIC